MQKRLYILVLGSIFVGALLLAIIYQLPPVSNWLSWRFASTRTQVRNALNPPEAAVFIPQEQEKLETIAVYSSPSATPDSISLPTHTAIPPATLPSPILTSIATVTLTPTLPPIPESIILSGVVHEYQQMNNCGPATLSMALSYWGWHGDQRDTRAYLRPNYAKVDDKNVSPYEMVSFVETQTEFYAITRVGGNINLLKRLVSSGYPVIIEKGFQPPKEDWMGHYELITGYDDARGRFITQDSYIMPDFPVPYDDIVDRWWRDFNHIYVVIYPPGRQNEVHEILGKHADPDLNYQVSADKAAVETVNLTGRDLFFAWYNLGTNQLTQADFVNAAQAYDRAFGVYAELPEEERPWRILWYQTGPYEAYFHTGRYQDVINLVNQTLSTLGSPILEESLYWRGLAKEALGDVDGAIVDLTKAAEINPISTDALVQLNRLGVEIP